MDTFPDVGLPVLTNFRFVNVNVCIVLIGEEQRSVFKPLPVVLSARVPLPVLSFRTLV